MLQKCYLILPENAIQRFVLIIDFPELVFTHTYVYSFLTLPPPLVPSLANFRSLSPSWWSIVYVLSHSSFDCHLKLLFHFIPPLSLNTQFIHTFIHAYIRQISRVCVLKGCQFGTVPVTSWALSTTATTVPTQPNGGLALTRTIAYQAKKSSFGGSPPG